AAVHGGGGKILKRRQNATRNTPYDRPTQTTLQPNDNNNNNTWLNALLFPAKFVSGGASKLLSSVWYPKTWNLHSSYSEGGIEDDYDHVENLHDDGVALNHQNKCSSSGKSEVLHLVEQLLMLEHFSREECDRLIKIINSRVLDNTMNKGMDARP
ncbi:hypothetical protein M8C21_015860, partial [Ambrosia artemisiifolia]